MAQISDYTGLITSEHASKPNFAAMVGAVAGCFVDQQDFLESMPGAFDLSIAQGVQLDQIGLWVGISRDVTIPITNTYFSFDIAGIGWDQANWQGPYDPTTGIVALDDGTYRTLIIAKIGANSWDGTIPTTQQILAEAFPAGTSVFIQDNGDMSISFGIAGTQLPLVLQSVLAQGLIQLKPEGVSIDSYHMTSVSGAPLFGLDVENAYVSGLDVGAVDIVL